MSDNERRLFLDGLRSLLRPIAFFCVRHALKLQDLIDCAKRVFLEAADREMERTGVAKSASKIAVMTGMHRRDVSRLSGKDSPPRDDATLLSRVIGQWRGDARFLSDAGRPRILSIEGKESEFVQLVRTVSQDLNPYTVLFELERSASVERVPGGIQLRSAAFVASGDVRQALSILGSDIGDLVVAVEANVFQRITPPHLHIRTEYDNISADTLEELRLWLLEEGTKFHQRAQAFLAARDRDMNAQAEGKRQHIRVSLGSFCLVEERLTKQSPRAAQRGVAAIRGASKTKR